MGFTYTTSGTTLTTVTWTAGPESTIAQIPSGITIIAVSAFSTASVKPILTGVNFSNVTTTLTTIADNAFNSCVALTTVTIPDSVSSIGISAFQSCSNLVSFVWPLSSTDVNDSTFRDCTSLASITGPNAINYIYQYAFYNCSALTAFDIFDRETLYLVEGYAFYGCSSLDSIDLSTNSGDFIIAGPSVFQNCSKLTYINFPIGSSDVPSNMFNGCLLLETVDNFSNSIVSIIRSYAFANCTSLKQLILPETTTGLNTVGISNNVFQNSGLTSFEWPNGNYVIGQYTFQGCASLTTITNIGAVTSIGIDAFRASGLTTIAWPLAVTTIRPDAFRSCTSLASITNISAVTTIGANAFANSGFTSFSWSPSVPIVETGMFQGSQLLTTVSFPAEVTQIKTLAFDSTPELVDLTFGSTLTTLDSGSFSNTTAINDTSPNYDSLTTMIIQGYTSPQLKTAGFDPDAVDAAVTASCFNEDTKILCFKDGEEQYVAVQDLQPGDLVKTHLHEYKKVDLIGKSSLRNDINNKWKNRMFVMYKTDENGLTEDLIMTGGHSILVDKLTDEEVSHYKKYKLLIINNKPIKIDDKYLLLAGVSKQFTAIEDNEVYTYYNFCLENDGDDDKRFGVFANGILAETPSKSQFLKFKGYKLD
jgi:hypothetical protein